MTEKNYLSNDFLMNNENIFLHKTKTKMQCNGMRTWQKINTK